MKGALGRHNGAIRYADLAALMTPLNMPVGGGVMENLRNAAAQLSTPP